MGDKSKGKGNKSAKKPPKPPKGGLRPHEQRLQEAAVKDAR
jgi:hypothetical protein